MRLPRARPGMLVAPDAIIHLFCVVREKARKTGREEKRKKEEVADGKVCTAVSTYYVCTQ